MAKRKQSRPLRANDSGYHGEDFPDTARRYPGYAHDFASPQELGEFSEEFKSWRKNRDSAPVGIKDRTK